MSLCHMCHGSGMLWEASCSGKLLELCCAPCTRLAELDKKIAELLAQRRALQSDINQEHDTFTRRLPTEICAEIFYNTLPSINLVSETYKDGPISHRMSSVPLLPSQVCRTWRAICHSTPELWNLLTLYLSNSPNAVESAADALEWSWVGRAGPSLPLSIIIFEGDAFNSTTLSSARCRSIFNLITTYAPRFSYLQATVSEFALGEICRAYQDRSSLKTLRVFTVPGGASRYEDNGPKFCPSVLNISWHGWEVAAIDTSILTHIDVTGFLIQDCEALIANSPRLVSCTLHGSISGAPQIPFHLPVNSQPLIRSCLKYLCLGHAEDHLSIPYILDKFSFPSLESLTLRPIRHNQQDVFVAVLRHLRRSGSSLRVLLFSGIWLQNPEYYSYFSELIDVMAPTLKELTLTNASYGEPYRQYLSSLFESVLPRLRNLSSLTVSSPINEWLFMLQISLKASLSIVTPNQQDLSITLWSFESPLKFGSSYSFDLESVASDYQTYGGHGSLKAADIQSILETMQHRQICLKVKHAPDMRLGAQFPPDVDISEEITVALGSLLRDTQA